MQPERLQDGAPPVQRRTAPQSGHERYPHRWMADVIRAVGLTIAWLTLAFVALAMPPAFGLPWMVLVTVAFVWRRAIAPLRRRDRRLLRRFRVRRIPDTRRLVLVALPSLLLAGAGMSLLLARITGPETTESPAWDLINSYAATPAGFAAVALLVAVLGPLIEEFYFRGLMQRSLERRFAVLPAVVATAAAFSFIHLHGWPWSVHPFVLGVLWGYAAHATRSIWTTVVLHGAWNGTLLLVGVAVPDMAEPWDLPPAAVWLLPLAFVAGIAGFRRWYVTTARAADGQGR